MGLAAVGGGAVFLSGLRATALTADGSGAGAFGSEDFYFVQISDTHWGYTGPANPDAANTLKEAVATVNALEIQPDFIMFTGDLTHTTDDATERRKRLTEFREIVGALKVKSVRFIPGEHDAALDGGRAFKELFGQPNYSFDHKGVHFVTVDNVSDPGASIGESQLEWLKADLSKQTQDAPIVVFTHRPLFDLAPEWDWATRDGAKAVDLLMPYRNVTVFYGHIHQEHHHLTAHIAHHSAKSLIFPLPAPHSQEKRAPLPWDPSSPNRGLGFREVDADAKQARYNITEFPVTTEAKNRTEDQVIKIVAKKFSYSPNEIVVKKGRPAVLEFTSLDFTHGFKIPDLGVRADLPPGKITRVRVVSQKAGVFPFLCDNFCGSGHEGMTGRIIVED